MTALTQVRSGFAALRARLAWPSRAGRQEHVPVRDWVSVSPGQPTRLLGFDQTLVWVVVALLALGLVMVYSASVAMPDNPKFARYTPTYFLTRHVLSIAVAALASRRKRWRVCSPSITCWRASTATTMPCTSAVTHQAPYSSTGRAQA